MTRTGGKNFVSRSSSWELRLVAIVFLVTALCGWGVLAGARAIGGSPQRWEDLGGAALVASFATYFVTTIRWLILQGIASGALAGIEGEATRLRRLLLRGRLDAGPMNPELMPAYVLWARVTVRHEILQTLSMVLLFVSLGGQQFGSLTSSEGWGHDLTVAVFIFFGLSILIFIPLTVLRVISLRRFVRANEHVLTQEDRDSAH